MSLVSPETSLACPVPWNDSDRILLAHGEGGYLSRKLLREVILPALSNPYLQSAGDSAILPQATGRLAMTTDGFVVSPLVFPGGDIGSLAIHGTINDLAVCGARPLYASVGFILEEGLPLTTLRQILASLARAAAESKVAVVAGDTKVVPRGAADGMFIHTTGVGVMPDGLDWGPHRVQAGDRILVSGTLGDHGLAILSSRAGLELEGDLKSDSAALTDLVAPLVTLGPDVRFLRDPTRGGLAAVLHEVALAGSVGTVINEVEIPLSPAVRGAAALLGLDPVFVANEGKVVVIVAPEAAQQTLALLRAHPLGRHATAVGVVTGDAGAVLVRSPLGTLRVLDEPQGAPLPRIC